MAKDFRDGLDGDGSNLDTICGEVKNFAQDGEKASNPTGDDED